MEPKLVILTGISGAGKSTALNAFEDMGYFCINNLPGLMIEDFINKLVVVDSISDEYSENYALLIDCRSKEYVSTVKAALKKLKDSSIPVSLIFLDCSDDVAVRRFRETRRPHQKKKKKYLQQNFNNIPIKTVEDAIGRERVLLSSLREEADNIIETSIYTPHQLRDKIEKLMGGRKDLLEVTLLSFGFKYGLPTDADLIIDVRFLPNPYFIPELKDHTGMDQDVYDFVNSNQDAKEFISTYMSLLNFLLPKYFKEGKRYLTIGFGCTGGKHRSVALAEYFSKNLKGVNSVIQHRDIGK